MMSFGTAPVLFGLASSNLDHLRASPVFHSAYIDSVLCRYRPLCWYVLRSFCLYRLVANPKSDTKFLRLCRNPRCWRARVTWIDNHKEQILTTEQKVYWIYVYEILQAIRRSSEQPTPTEHPATSVWVHGETKIYDILTLYPPLLHYRIPVISRHKENRNSMVLF
jgi:hypothetical protein